MAWRMVMTVCVLVYAALEYRRRTGLKDHEATVPDQPGKRLQHPTARWVCHSCVGMQLGRIPGPWPRVLNLTAAQHHLRHLLGDRDAWLYRGNIPNISASLRHVGSMGQFGILRHAHVSGS